MKTCLITGANSGIGKAAAIQIAQQGVRVFIGARNQQRGEKAVEEIKYASNSENVELILIDLASKISISSAAEQLNNKVDQLDVLIHNAADFDITRKQVVKSVDGIEQVWATNHIGVVQLTHLLLDKIKASKQGRILTIASQGLMMHPKMKVNLEDPEFKNRKFSVAKAYYQSKLAQVMYTYWLAEKLKDINVTINCIRVTNVKIDISRYPHLSGFMKFLYSIKSKFSITPEKMAETYTYLATSKEVEKINGKYFNEKNKEVKSSSYSMNPSNIKAVMEMSMKYFN